MKKETWLTHGIAYCEDCGWTYEYYKNAQALGAKHAKKYKHIVHVEVGLSSKYNGKE